MRTRRHGLSLLLASAGAAVTGQGIVIAAGPLLAASLTRDPFAVSAVSAASPAAWLLVGLPAGALVDRVSRRRVMVWTDALRAVLLAGLAAAIWTGTASIPVLIGVVFLVGVGSCFFDPAAQAIIPRLVGRQGRTLTRANGKMWAIDTFGRGLAGPPVGALLFGLVMALPFGVVGLAFAASAVFLIGLPRDEPPEHPERHTLTADVREGVRFLSTNPELRALTLGMASYNLGYNAAFATLVLFVQDVLNLPGTGFGLLVAAMALGGIAGGWAAAHMAEHLSARAVYAVALSVQGGAWLLTGITRNLAVTVVCLVVVGLASTTVSVVGGSARQLLTPDNMLGRLTSATRLFGIGAAAVGALLGGAIADHWGLIAPPIAAAVVLAVCGLAFGTLARKGRRLVRHQSKH